MADVNVTLRRYNGTTWDNLYPTTILSQITDATTLGRNLASLSAVQNNAFIRVGSCDIAGLTTQAECEAATGTWDGTTVTLLNATNLKTELDAADRVHEHTIAEITGLDTALLGKADLESGKLKSSQIPEFLLSGLRFVNTISTPTVTLESLKALLTETADDYKAGGYFIATVDTVVSYTTQSIGAKDDGDESASGFTLETGDWLVYAGNDVWDVVNNTYRAAEVGVYGVVQLSDGASTLRSQLNENISSTDVMTEAAVRNVMKYIFYQSSEPANAATGDLLFQGSF